MSLALSRRPPRSTSSSGCCRGAASRDTSRRCGEFRCSARSCGPRGVGRATQPEPSRTGVAAARRSREAPDRPVVVKLVERLRGRARCTGQNDDDCRDEVTSHEPFSPCPVVQRGGGKAFHPRIFSISRRSRFVGRPAPRSRSTGASSRTCTGVSSSYIVRASTFETFPSGTNCTTTRR